MIDLNTNNRDKNSVSSQGSYDYTMSLYMAMVTIRVMDAIKEEFPDAYPDKKLCLAGNGDDLSAGVAFMNLSRNGSLENEMISNRKPWIA